MKRYRELLEFLTFTVWFVLGVVLPLAFAVMCRGCEAQAVQDRHDAAVGAAMAERERR